MDPTIASNETPASRTKKAAPAPFIHDSGPNPWYQSKWFVYTGSTIFFLAFFIIVIYLSITESQPITATPTKPPTSAPVEIVNTTAPSPLTLTSAPAQAPALSSAPVALSSAPVALSSAPVALSSAPVASGTNTALQIACAFIKKDISVCPTIANVFAGTTLTGVTIPSEIGLLTALTFVNLRDAGLTGSIPSTLSSLVGLKTFNVTGNALTGTVPDLLCTLGLAAAVDCGEVSCSCCASASGAAC